MKYTICILLFCALFLVNNVNSLQGGTNVIALGTHPSHALVVVNGVPFGGTIVHTTHIVTSCRAVLTDNNLLRPLGQFVIRVGSLTFNEGVSNTVTAIFPHPEFNPWTLNNDVAVLRTTNPLPFNQIIPNPPVAPAVFNERVVAVDTPCIVVGFNDPAAGVANPILQQLAQPILNRDTQCNAPAAHNGRVMETMLCAGTLAAGSGICNSTLGGGIYCLGNFTGIASSGSACGLANSPAVYTQVRHHIQWINTQFTRTQIPGEGPTPPPGVSNGILSTVTSSLLIFVAFLFTKL